MEAQICRSNGGNDFLLSLLINSEQNVIGISTQSVQNVEPLELNGQKSQKPNVCAEDCAWHGDKTGLCNFVPGLLSLQILAL